MGDYVNSELQIRGGFFIFPSEVDPSRFSAIMSYYSTGEGVTVVRMNLLIIEA